MHNTPDEWAKACEELIQRNKKLIKANNIHKETLSTAIKIIGIQQDTINVLLEKGWGGGWETPKGLTYKYWKDIWNRA